MLKMPYLLVMKEKFGGIDILHIIGLVLGYGMLVLLGSVGFFG